MLRRFTNSNGTTILTYPFGIEEHQYSGAGSNQWNVYYYFLAGRLLGSLDGNGTQFYLVDALGSLVSAFTNAAGGAALKGNQLFGPYGVNRYFAGTINTAKGFIGQYNDGTGLDYFNARYYDPVVGVFLSADTVQGNLQGLNPYAYVNGNPETHSDSTGRYIVGPSGQTYYPGSPYYTQGGEAYSVKTGQPYTGNGFTNGWRPGQGPNAAPALTPFSAPRITAKPTLRPNKTILLPDNLNSCGMPGSSQALCGNFYVNFAIYLATGGAIGMPGPWSLCPECGPGGGPNDSGESRGFRDLTNELASEDEGCSFTAKTVVATDYGKRSISSLHVGEKVWAYNPKTHKMEQEPILHVWINHDNDLVDLTLTTTTSAGHGKAATKTSEVVHTNKKHPFLTKEEGFLPVGQLKLGMHVLRADGTYGVVTGWKMVPGTQVMYNLEVAQDHTFTVGIQQWVVHNCSGVPPEAGQVANYAQANGGAAQPGYVGDRPFANDGRDGGQVLPQTTPDGQPTTYREYDVNPYTPGVNRGSERVVIGSDGSRWYTDNHYKTFTQF